MASIKLKYRPSSTDNQEGVLSYQIIHKRIIRLIKPSHLIFNTEWNNATGSIIVRPDTPRTAYLQLIRDKVGWEMRQLRGIVSGFELSGLAQLSLLFPVFLALLYIWQSF